MRVYYANRTNFHEGSVAIDQAIWTQLKSQGHEIWAICDRPNGPEPHALKECDALVVNGEGTFRDELRAWEPGRIDRLMNGMLLAKEWGKRVHFINTVWCNMHNDWSHVLRELDEVAVREVISRDEMAATQGITPAVYLDASYYADVRSESVFDYRKEIVLGKIYPHNFPDKLTAGHPIFDPYRKNLLPIQDPGWGYTWSTIVSSLRSAGLYITGQHHGVYAACVAKVPFVYCKVNTHKVEGLFKWAGVGIPTVRTARDVHHCVRWAFEHPDEYEKLFAFMDSVPRWPGLIH